jgi:hypothetical protein
MDLYENSLLKSVACLSADFSTVVSHWNAVASGTLLKVDSRRGKLPTTPPVFKSSSYKMQSQSVHFAVPRK